MRRWHVGGGWVGGVRARLLQQCSEASLAAACSYLQYSSYNAWRNMKQGSGGRGRLIGTEAEWIGQRERQCQRTAGNKMRRDGMRTCAQRIARSCRAVVYTVEKRGPHLAGCKKRRGEYKAAVHRLQGCCVIEQLECQQAAAGVQPAAKHRRLPAATLLGGYLCASAPSRVRGVHFA